MKTRQDGFTLIETILVLLAGAILSALVTSVMGVSFTRGVETVQRQRDDFRVEQALAQVTRDYVSLTNDAATRTTALDVLKANIDAGNYNAGDAITVNAAWVAYDIAGVESVDGSGANQTLKVTASWVGGRTLASLYTRPRPDPTTQTVWF
ncbi:MAG: PulJ/GspJ family protein [Thermodesulfobacteriota bacterium]